MLENNEQHDSAKRLKESLKTFKDEFKRFSEIDAQDFDESKRSFHTLISSLNTINQNRIKHAQDFELISGSNNQLDYTAKTVNQILDPTNIRRIDALVTAEESSLSRLISQYERAQSTPKISEHISSASTQQLRK